MNPRMPYSAPAIPTITLSLTMSGRDRCRVALRVIVDLDVEQDVAGPAVERHQVGVERGHVETIAADGEAAVDAPAADVQTLGQLPPVVPDLTTGSRIEGPGVIVRARQVHDAVDDERRGFERGPGRRSETSTAR